MEPLFNSAVRWYRLDGHEPVLMHTQAEHVDEWDRRTRDIFERGIDPYRVALTDLDDRRYVSTVFLGLDHQLGLDGPPLLFETMVFPECDVCVRYSTWDQALAGHDQIAAAERDDQRAGERNG